MPAFIVTHPRVRDKSLRDRGRIFVPKTRDKDPSPVPEYFRFILNGVFGIIRIENDWEAGVTMRALDIIVKKRNGGELTRAEIGFFVEAYCAGRIPDYQAAAWLMAVYFQGMTRRETVDLTLAMVQSGETVDLSPIPGVKVDKHSTGGVGDTTTLIAAPLAAACGVPIAKMSGRGLGHTGGTLDKLESIPGFRTDLSRAEFIKTVKSAGLAVIGQSQDLVPADKLFYALRDVTGTVDSLPLIAASVMSKKIAAGANALVLDVKTGSGAFMKTEQAAFDLAAAMVQIGIEAGRETTALVTDMDQPLGLAVGNALEVWEAIEILKGMHRGPLREVSLLLAAYMVFTGALAKDAAEAREQVEEALVSGKGLKKFKKMIRAQGGDERVLEDTGLLPGAHTVVPIKTEHGGYIQAIDGQKVGYAALLLGAGRFTKEDVLDLGAGLVLHKRIGDYVHAGDTLADFYVNEGEHYLEAVSVLRDAVTVGPEKSAVRPLVFGAVTREGADRSLVVYPD